MFSNFLGILFESLIKKLHFLAGVIFRSFLTPICEYVIFISMCSRVKHSQSHSQELLMVYYDRI